MNKKEEYEKLYNECVALKEECDALQKELEKSALSLYEIRKDSLGKMIQLRDYLNNLANCPEILTIGMLHAFEYAKFLSDGINLETTLKNDETIKEESELKDNKGNIVAGVGVVTGAGTALAGPTAAIAIATTFGTAGSGVAISSLGGIAATNAALAWLGGGTLAAGGAGMAGGSALLAAFGPIGAGIAVVAIGGWAIARWKHKKQNEQKYVEAIEQNSRAKDQLLRTKEIIISLIDKIEVLIIRTKEQTVKIVVPRIFKQKDYNNKNFHKQELFEAVNDAKVLGKLLCQTI